MNAMSALTIAYFSMEIGLESGLPTYSGGLGVLAGDTIKAAADLELPMIGMTLLYNRGYFKQTLDIEAGQHEGPVEWAPDQFLSEQSTRVYVTIEGRSVALRCWRYIVTGVTGHEVPVYFLDADLEGNAEHDRELTNHLYGGESYHRLCQEVILGMGGVRMLRALGYDQIECFHMNEGHASLLAVELAREEVKSAGIEFLNQEVVESIKKRCVFTTHTPVPAGHDRFPIGLVVQVLGDALDFINFSDPYNARILSQILHANVHEGSMINLVKSGSLNMTYLALELSRHVNGVAKKHGEVSREMFPGYKIGAITNGVHVVTWAAPPLKALFDECLPDWRRDNFELRNALRIDGQQLWNAHQKAKGDLLATVQERKGVALDPEVLTIGFARRFAMYKRADLIFSDLKRLETIADSHGALQVVFAGKAHPRDGGGKQLIKNVLAAAEALGPQVKVVFLDNYDMNLGLLITSGVDVWLNNPVRPMEASGTSGMKSALNGVPSLSVLDGWWIEGCVEGVTGWAIGDLAEMQDREEARVMDADALYQKLEHAVLPTYYKDRAAFIKIMGHSIALNGPFFSTQRMMEQYAVRSYYPVHL